MVVFAMALSGKLTKKLVENLGAGRHGDGNGLYLVVDPSGARRWIVRVVGEGPEEPARARPLRTDFGLGGADIVTLEPGPRPGARISSHGQAGPEPAIQCPAGKCRPSRKSPSRSISNACRPGRIAKHGQQWINTLRDYAFPKIGRMPVDSIGQPEVLMCLSPIWTEKHETARRLAQRIKTVLDVARSKGFREGENPVTAIKEARRSAEGQGQAEASQGDALAGCAGLLCRTARRAGRMAAKALMFTCLTGSRTGEVLGMRWEEIDFEARLWTCPADRMKGGVEHRVPLTPRDARDPRAAAGAELGLCLRGPEAAPAAVEHGDADAAAADGHGG